MRSNKFFPTALLLLLSVASAHAASRDLLARGSSEMYWIARIGTDPTGQIQTTIQSRPIGSDGSWKQIAQLSDRVVSITRGDSNLTVLLAGGDWMTLWDGGSSGGVLPDDGSKLIMLAGGGDAGLWAIASAHAGIAPTTSVATQPAATMPAGTLLFDRLSQGRWVTLAPLPPSAKAAKDLSLAFLDGHATLAILLDKGEVRTLAWNSERGDWDSTMRINADAATTRIKLLDGLPHSALWTAGDSGGGVIHFADQPPIPLAMPAGVSVGDVTVTGGSIRALSIESGKIAEYAFAPDGSSRGKNILPMPTAPAQDKPFEWLSAVAAGMLVLVLLNSMRRREGSPLELLEQAGIVLAPLGRRWVAGTIDALPILGMMFYLAFRMQPSESEDIQTLAASIQIPLLIATAIYLLHTLICEWMWGWTLGKKLCGLRVAMLDGTPPSTQAIVLRNLLRVIDVAMFFPLLLILISPLRQRVGDLAAETIVILQKPSPGI
ncbi:MAG TPA: RDD family protein [Tepidisphaeraceae bacterium]